MFTVRLLLAKRPLGVYRLYGSAKSTASFEIKVPVLLERHFGQF
jgi:hypothetical protein